jgi:TrmH family RNA methyltransferase
LRHRRTQQISAGKTYNEPLRNKPQRDRVEIVLVSPRNPLNIGAAARAMANFGFDRLTVVDPWEPHWREAKSAVEADNLLRKARRTESLAEAVAGCSLVLGTGTLTHRKPEQPVVALPNLGPVVCCAVECDARVAMVFGPEKHGLTRDHLSYCHQVVVIPTDTHQPSMNLGQAVAVCLYELARDGNDEEPARIRAMPKLAAADSASLERVARLIEETMQRAGYSPKAMQEANRHDLRILLRRLQLQTRDSRRILGLFRRILARMTAKAPSDDDKK